MKYAPTGKLIKDATLVLVIFVVLGILVFPFLWVVLTSLRPPGEIFTRTFRLIPSTVTLDNYRALFGQSNFAVYIRNSLIVVVTATFFTSIISLLAAYSFSRRRFRGRSLLLILVVATQLFPWIILTTPIYIIFFRLGLVNNYLGLIISYVAITTPFSIYLLLGYLDGIPRELDEAGVIDGCSTLGVIFRVVLPVAWPGLVVVATYAFVIAWDEFLFALILMTNDSLKTVPLGLANLFGQYSTQWNLVMAASTVATVPTMILFLFLQRRLVSGLAAGAVKE